MVVNLLITIKLMKKYLSLDKRKMFKINETSNSVIYGSVIQNQNVTTPGTTLATTSLLTSKSNSESIRTHSINQISELIELLGEDQQRRDSLKRLQLQLATTNHQTDTLISAFTDTSRRKKRRVYTKTAKTLLLVSSVFLVLNAPYVYSKMRHYLSDFELFIHNHKEKAHLNSTANNQTALKTNYVQIEEESLNQEIIDRISYYLFYLNYSINFLLYTFNGKKFKSLFFNFCKNMN
jgi:hypothetical protein